MKRKLLASILVITFILINICGTSLATTQADIDKLKKEKTEKQNELNQITTEKKSVQDEIDDLRSQIDSLQAELYDLQSKLDGLNSSIKSKESEITQKQAELEEKKELLKKRLVVMYKKGGMSYLDVLLGSGNLFEMLVNFDAVQEVTEADNDLINKVTQEKQDLENAKTELENEKKQVDDVKSQKEAKNQELTEKKNEKDEKVKNLTSEQKAKQTKIDEYDSAIKKGEQEIQEEIRKNLASNTNKSKNKGSNNSSSGNNKSRINNSKGDLGWPLSSVYQKYSCITSYYGPRERPTAGASTNHGAIDIGVSYEPVYAAESGIVITAKAVQGYGNFIMIWHNGRGQLYTCYGHLSKFLVDAGDEVSRGEQIAVSGNTGVSTGPHLHFEVRLGGSSKSCRVNPLEHVIVY